MNKGSRDRPATSHYTVLDVRSDATSTEIRNAYRKLVMKGERAWMMEEAKNRFQQIQEAYQVLSNEKWRKLYDRGLYDPLEEEDEGFDDFLDEMISLMDHVKREEREYSLQELEQMLFEMSRDFESPI